MNDLVTLITCTGNRPEAFALCQKYVKAQVYHGPIQWIVVHDEEGDFLPGASMGMEVYRGTTTWSEGINTQRSNMEEALKHVKGAYIFCIEDDDLYNPEYVATMVELLQHCEIAGEAQSKYYHIGLPGYKEMRNYYHASLCQTAIRRSVLPLLKQAVCSGELYFDIHLWRNVHEKRIKSLLLADSDMVIGIKGMPGRGNIGVGGTKLKDYLLDPSLAKLREWCGVHANNYSPFIKRTNGRTDTGKRNEGGLLREVSKPGTSKWFTPKA